MARKKSTSKVFGLGMMVVLALAVVLGVNQLNKTQDLRSRASDATISTTKQCVFMGNICILINGTSLYVNNIQAQYNVHTALPVIGKFTLKKNGSFMKYSDQKTYKSFGWQKWHVWPISKYFRDGDEFCVSFSKDPDQEACGEIKN